MGLTQNGLDRQVFGFRGLSDLKDYETINSYIDSFELIEWFKNEEYWPLNFLLREGILEYKFKGKKKIVYFKVVSENYLHIEQYENKGTNLNLILMANIEFLNKHYEIYPIKFINQRRSLWGQLLKATVDQQILAQFYYLDYFVKNKIVVVKNTNSNIKEPKGKHTYSDSKKTQVSIISSERIVYKVPNALNNNITHRTINRKTESWNVIGHYRHYKNGKVVFIKSYIKGKGSKAHKEYKILSKKQKERIR